MTSPFTGQIELFAFDAVPRGWAQCDGRLLPINRNQALFALLGTAYGGDGQTQFALPDLRGRVPIGLGGDVVLGQRSGEEMHALSTAEMPAHSHSLMADAVSTATGHEPAPTTVLGQSSGRATGGVPTFSANLYAAGNPGAVLNAGAVVPVGGGQRHENRMPSRALNFCICIDGGAYPPRTRTVLTTMQTMLRSVGAVFGRRP